MSQSLHPKGLLGDVILKQQEWGKKGSDRERQSKCLSCALLSWSQLHKRKQLMTRQGLCLPDRLCGTTTLWNHFPLLKVYPWSVNTAALRDCLSWSFSSVAGLRRSYAPQHGLGPLVISGILEPLWSLCRGFVVSLLKPCSHSRGGWDNPQCCARRWSHVTDGIGEGYGDKKIWRGT